MAKLTPAYRSVLFSLWYKRNYFGRKGKLSSDGSFYYDDKRLALEQNVSARTIKRAREFLKKEGHIAYVAGTCRGHATKYWVLRKPDKKSPFVDISKPDNLSGKEYKLSLKAPQNVTPNNISNKYINKDDFSSVSKDDLRNGIKGLINCKGVDYAKKFYANKGFSEEVIQEIINNLQGGNDKC